MVNPLQRYVAEDEPVNSPSSAVTVHVISPGGTLVVSRESDVPKDVPAASVHS